MSKSSKVIRRTYEAWNRNDLDSWLETYHSDGELDASGLFPDVDPVYRGRDRLAEFWRRMHEAWEVFRIDIEQADQEDDCFTVAVRFRAKGVHSGVDVDMRFGHAFRIRDGRIAELISRRTLEEAREALRERGRPVRAASDHNRRPET